MSKKSIKRAKKLIVSKKWAKEKEVFDDAIERIGFWNLNVTVFGKKYNIPRATVERWKLDYIDKVGIPKIKTLGKELNLNNQALMKQLVRIAMSSNDDRTKILATNSYFSSQEKYTEFLERFGYKEKEAEKPDMPEKIEVMWKESIK